MRTAEEIREEIEKIKHEWPVGSVSRVAMLILELLYDIRELIREKGNK